MPRTSEAPWWRDAVVYQVYVRSFADSDGDGLGDLPGITDRLPHLADLGVDALWITPFYTSPQRDHGYDVADYRDVDPRFGTLADFDALLARAHDLGLKVIVDIVPNHTSSDHAWFQAAQAAPAGSPERARYLFRDGRGPNGTEPPNNWRSVFGGSAWQRVSDGQWYLHLFDVSQPDLDWTNPEVWEEFRSVLRFWLDRGVDGFRVDVAHSLIKEDGLPDTTETHEQRLTEGVLEEPMWDRPGVHEIWRDWRKVLDSYGTGPGGDKMMVGEAWTATEERLAAYLRPDEMHQAFNFLWLLAPWSAAAFRDVVRDTYATTDPVGASPTWVLSNHDVTRHATRYGGGPQGLNRARAATMTMLAMPGSAYLYQGEELGLEEVEVPREQRQDPAFLRGENDGRDGCRVPIPWAGEEPPYGFGPGEGQPWLPQPLTWAGLTVAAQTGDESSTLEFYRRVLAARRELDVDAGLEMLDVDEEVLAFRRGAVTVWLNCGDLPVKLPVDSEVWLASAPVDDGLLPADTAVWLREA